MENRIRMNREQMRTWIEDREHDFLEDIQILINIPSVSVETGNPDMPFGEPCRRVLEKALSICDAMGFQGFYHEGYCATVLWKGESEEEIGIFAHLDVVPEGTGWNYEPYRAIVEDGYIVGRGAGDNKGPAMAALYAMKYLKDSGWKPGHSVRMFFGANEECGMKDIEYYTKHYPMPSFSFTPDASFPVCHGEKGVLELEASYSIEGSNLLDFYAGVASNAVPADAYAVLTTSYEEAAEVLKGRECRVEEWDPDSCGVKTVSGKGCKISVKGIAAHAAFPEGSESAEVKLAALLKESALVDEKGSGLLDAVCDLFSDYYGAGMGIAYEDQVSGRLTHVGGMVRTHEKTVKQNINIRYPVRTDRLMMMQDITRHLAEHGFTLEKTSDNPPCYMDEDTLIIHKLTEISNRHLGMDLKPYVMGGGTYARKLKNAVGYGPGISSIPSRFGPDRGKGHQPDESMSVELLKKAIAIYAEAIVAIDEMIPIG